jgi:hypothetical protein
MGKEFGELDLVVVERDGLIPCRGYEGFGREAAAELSNLK